MAPQAPAKKKPTKKAVKKPAKRAGFEEGI